MLDDGTLKQNNGELIFIQTVSIALNEYGFEDAGKIFVLNMRSISYGGSLKVNFNIEAGQESLNSMLITHLCLF